MKLTFFYKLIDRVAWKGKDLEYTMWWVCDMELSMPD